MLEARLQQVVFRAEGEAYDWADAAFGSACRGEWLAVEASLLEGLACEQQLEQGVKDVSEEELNSAATRFRYARGLISADETQAWLDACGLDHDDWFRFLHRSELRRRSSISPDLTRDTLQATDAQFDREVWIEAICSGALPQACRDLADRAALSAAGVISTDGQQVREAIERLHLGIRDASVWSTLLGTPDRAERIAGLEVNFEAARRQSPTRRSLESCLATHHLDWIRIDTRALRFERKEMALEACLRVREDGDELTEVALDAKLRVDHKEFFLEELPETQRARFIAAKAGEFVGPVEIDSDFGVYQIDGKTLPDLRAPEIAARARSRVWLDRVGHAVDEHVRWELVP
jgi:hypothetical protein